MFLPFKLYKMSTQEVADRLVELCRIGANEKAHEDLYASHAISIEPKGAPNQIVKGLDAIKAKGQHFRASIEKVHEGFVGAPIVAADYFAVTMGLDATLKDMGRIKMAEIVVYKVENGKIVQEQFFFDPLKASS